MARVSNDFDPYVDPDVDLHDPAQRAETRQWDIVAVAALGGAAGAVARYGIELALPHWNGQFPWATLVINASGCALIGVLMAVLHRTRPHRLVRPLLGTGVLGGYTTFSSFSVDTEQLVLADRPIVALAYVLLTLAACVAAVAVAGSFTHRVRRR